MPEISANAFDLMPFYCSVFTKHHTWHSESQENMFCLSVFLAAEYIPRIARRITILQPVCQEFERLFEVIWKVKRAEMMWRGIEMEKLCIRICECSFSSPPRLPSLPHLLLVLSLPLYLRVNQSNR